MKDKKLLEKRLNRGVWVISAVVLMTVGLMRRVKIDVGIDFSFLPPLHAGFNIMVAVSLIFALVFVKKKNIEAHRKAIFVAMFFSFLFLLSYILYHFTTQETTYCHQGTIRTIYFVLLVSHIVLAGASLPFILFTFVRGYVDSRERHRSLARWVWPVWFYVSISGPICYFMLRSCY